MEQVVVGLSKFSESSTLQLYVLEIMANNAAGHNVMP